MEQFREIRQGITLNSHGKKLFGTLHLPDGEGPFPAVLICHGFAGTKVGKFRLYVRLSETLAKHGIAALRIDYRGCGDSEGDYLDTTLSTKVEDSVLSLNFLKEHPKIDAERLAVMGRSLGGPVAVLAANAFKNISSIVLWAALFSPQPWSEHWKAHIERDAYDPNAPVSFLGELSSTKMIQDIFSLDMNEALSHLTETPLLIVYSENDQVISTDQQEQYREARKSASAPTQFVCLEKGDHHFHFTEEQSVAVDATVYFFMEHFGMVEHSKGSAN